MLYAGYTCQMDGVGAMESGKRAWIEVVVVVVCRDTYQVDRVGALATGGKGLLLLFADGIDRAVAVLCRVCIVQCTLCMRKTAHMHFGPKLVSMSIMSLR